MLSSCYQNLKPSYLLVYEKMKNSFFVEREFGALFRLQRSFCYACIAMEDVHRLPTRLTTWMEVESGWARSGVSITGLEEFLPPVAISRESSTK